MHRAQDETWEDLGVHMWTIGIRLCQNIKFLTFSHASEILVKSHCERNLVHRCKYVDVKLNLLHPRVLGTLAYNFVTPGALREHDPLGESSWQRHHVEVVKAVNQIALQNFFPNQEDSMMTQCFSLIETGASRKSADRIPFVRESKQ